MAEETNLQTSDSGNQRKFFYDDAPVPRAIKALRQRFKEKDDSNSDKENPSPPPEGTLAANNAATPREE